MDNFKADKNLQQWWLMTFWAEICLFMCLFYDLYRFFMILLILIEMLIGDYIFDHKKKRYLFTLLFDTK